MVKQTLLKRNWILLPLVSMSNEEEVKRLSEQLNSQKLLNFFKKTTKLKTKEIAYDKFINEVHG